MSLSEPHINGMAVRKFCIYSTSVTHAPTYSKHTGRMKYFAMITPRQENQLRPRGLYVV